MKKFMTIVIVMMALILPLSAKEQQGGSGSQQPIQLEKKQLKGENKKVPRAPIRIDISAIYDAADNRIYI